MSDEQLASAPVRAIDLRGRAWVLLQFVLVAAVCNSLALQLPGTTPFLVGNMAAVAITLRFGLSYGLPVAVLAAGITADAYWVGLSLLECLLVSRYGAEPSALWSAFLRIWLPLTPLVLWISLPVGAVDVPLWFLGATTIFLTGAVSLLGGRQLSRVSRSRKQMAKQSIGDQLRVQLATLMGAPLAVLIMLALQVAHQQDVQRTSLILDGRLRQLEAVTVQYLQEHQAAISFAARVMSEIPPSTVLTELAKAHPDFLTLLYTDASGELQGMQVPNDGFIKRDGDVSDREYFREPMRTGEPFVSPVFRGRGFGNDLIVAVSTTYASRTGEPLGVLQGALKLGRVAAELRLELDQAGVDYAVLDSRRQVVVSSLPAYPTLSLADSPGPLVATQRAQPAWARALFSAPEVRFSQGNTHLLAQRVSREAGWQVDTLAPLPPLVREQSVRTVFAALAVLLLILGTQFLARRFAERHMAPLRGVVERLRGLDPADPSSLQPLDVVAGSAEVSELVDDFNRAEVRLRDLHAEVLHSEKKQRQLNRELEQRVSERTSELSEALEHARHLAEAKAGFLANMSHELRTPLAAILGYSEQALSEGASATTARNALKTVARNGRHLLEIVNDVLDASKIDAGQLRIEAAAIAPLRVVGEAVDLLRERAREKGLGLSLWPQWPLPAHITADPLRLKQIVLNLISNALKFTEHGMVAVRVRADRDSSVWELEVEDTGIGMDEEQMQRLFMRFEQADLSTTRRFGGTGLGLYISRELARQMGGDIRVSSELGAGSRFTLSLPLSPDAMWVEGEDAAMTEDEVQAASIPRLRGRVLVVDDVEDLRLLVGGMVAATGAEVITAVNGRDAVEKATQQTVDLILMDMHMPIMDGSTATATLRASGFVAPIVALSADVLSEDVARFIASGCTEAMGKPVDRDRLYGALAHYLPAADDATAQANPVVMGPPLLAASVPEPPPVAEDPLAAAMAGIRARFRSGVSAELQALQEAKQAQNAEALKQQLHRLKGSAGTFGFMAVSQAAAAAEAAIKAKQDWPAIEARLAILEDELRRAEKD